MGKGAHVSAIRERPYRVIVKSATQHRPGLVAIKVARDASYNDGHSFDHERRVEPPNQNG